jgi:hypothetical protein
MSVVGIELIEGVCCLQMRIPINKKAYIDWRISKKLMPGSLVVLSPDWFHKIFVGIIKNRDSAEMNYTHKKFGYIAINIHIIKQNADLDTIQKII